MTVWEYRCISCGNMHEAPRRPEGSVYLRCSATREWAWYDPLAFSVVGVAAAAPARARSSGVRKVAAHSGRRAAARRSPKRTRGSIGRRRTSRPHARPKRKKR